MINGVIYQLLANNNHELFYIGSSIHAERREEEHNAGLINGTTYLYEKLREVGGGFTFIVLLEMECKSITELRDEEIEWIVEMKPTLNTIKYEYKKKQTTFCRMKRKNNKLTNERKRLNQLFINDLKDNPPIKREWISVSRDCPHKNGKSYPRDIIIWKDEIKLTDIPVWNLRNTKGEEIQ
tara:strand:- start:45 stop:587 length:543 start_codon:yes stop_codon:yes gene_type:complete